MKPTSVPARTLPIRVEPIEGEALDSWLEALGYRFSAAWGDMVAAAGLPGQDQTGAFSPLASLNAAQTDVLGTVTGVAPALLHRMTLAHHHGTGLAIRAGTDKVDRAFPWSRMRYSRFCPDCLRDTGGRWQLFWRLGWAFACEQHRCLLVDECPACRQRQRERPLPIELVPHPGHCATPASQSTGRAPARCDVNDLAQKLSARHLEQLYREQNLSAPQIAARYGVSRQTVIRLARQYGLEIRPAHRYCTHETIGADWLYAEYVINGRTLPDLAAEKGMSTANMARWAKVHGIELRGRGGRSHSASMEALKAARHAPEILRPALDQIGGHERLARFVAASRFPTLTSAAQQLSIAQFTLVNQINRIAKELGGPLFDRAQRGRPMTLTPLGTRVVDAWTGWTTQLSCGEGAR
ncbi:TniQ family protein [Mycobacterium sp. NPDC050853]|uniref:TniQ family protein n=1 Tax=Mycobacterium sp. NPDC050853 TaxID=3155160 RepID=UPI0033DCD092